MIVAKYRKSELLSNYAILTIFALFAALPILLLVMNSIKPQEEFGINVFQHIGKSIYSADLTKKLREDI